MTQNTDNLICVAELTSPHGIKGLLKLHNFATTPDTLLDHGPLLDKNGTPLPDIEQLTPHKGANFLVKFAGIQYRDQSEKLAKTKLYLPRDILPEIEEEDSFYFVDLIGLTVHHEEDTDYGIVKAVHNFGAGDLIEITPKKGKDFFHPFTKEAVPEVNIREQYLSIYIAPVIHAKADEA